MALFRELLWFFRLHRRTYVIALLMLAGVAVFSVTLPWLTGRVVDGLVGGEMARGEVVRHIGLMVVIAVAIYVLRFSWRVRLFGTSYLLGRTLRTRLYQRYSEQGFSFYRRRRSGQLMALATNDIDAVEMAAGEAVLAGFDGSLTFVLVLTLMVVLVDWRLTAVALLPLPLMGVAFYIISRHIHRYYKEALEGFSALNDHTLETLGGIRTVKAMGREGVDSQHFATIAERTAEANYHAQRWEAGYDPAIMLGMSATFLLTLSYGGYLILDDQMTMGQLTTFTLYIGQLIWPMFAFGWLLNLLERGSAAWWRLKAALEEPLSLRDEGRISEVASHALRFDQVSYGYPEVGNETQDSIEQNQQPVALKDINVSLRNGGTLGLVGPTGCGKSTLLKLILRQLEPDAGDIRLGETPIPQLQLAVLRDTIAWVPQEPMLFSGTVAENIALAKPDAGDDQIRQVARLAQVDSDITALPQGYQTRVGERGISLSGGQRQRVALARALLQQAPVMLLDDVLSAVDMHTEREILKNLLSLDHPPTTVIASHRLSAVAHADEILVLLHGEVIARGTHAELLRDADGWYAQMWAHQQWEADIDEQ